VVLKVVKKYKKKPVVIEAVQFVGDNLNEVVDFVGRNNSIFATKDFIDISTLEGVMRANLKDYIIKGVNGEFYPCKPDIFYKTYEED
jgi:hypothetical protein